MQESKSQGDKQIKELVAKKLSKNAVGRFILKYWLELVLVTPLVVYILGFTLVPVFTSILMSFQDPRTGQLTLDNYRYIIGHGQFKEALRNTIVIAGLSLTFEMIIGMTLAMMLIRPFRGKGLIRTILLTPMGVPTLVSAVMLGYIFDTSGYLNSFLYHVGLITIPIDWAEGGLKTILMIVFADMWKVTPLVILLLMAGLESIPGEVYESSAIDGASSWNTFWHITLPLMKPFITMTLIIRAIDAFRIFELALILAGRTTPVLTTYAYTEYWAYNNPHTSGAAATILLVLIMIFVLGYLRIVERERGEAR